LSGRLLHVCKDTAKEGKMKIRTKIEIDVIGNANADYQIRIIELIDEMDNLHNITRVITSPLLPNIRRVGYWLMRWATITDKQTAPMQVRKDEVMI